MHESYFSYTITRPYPYRSFTPTVLIGGAILLVLLSVLNFVQNGYTLTVQYVTDPNSTISNGIWFENWPCYGCVRATCEPANLAVNTQFFTNQTALTWTIWDIWKAKPGSNPEPSVQGTWPPFPPKAASDALPSVPYMNNRLEDCNIRSIQFSFDNTLAQPLPWYLLYIEVNAYVTCGIWGPFGYTMLNLDAAYAVKSATSELGTTNFVSTNTTSKSSAYWAQALLSAYMFETWQRMWSITRTTKPAPGKGWAILSTSTSQNISSLDFFNLYYTFMSPTLDLNSPEVHTWIGWHTNYSIGYYIGLGNNSTAAPQIWQPVDMLAKSMFSAVLTDLGQTDSASSNILANPQTLQAFSSHFPQIEQRSRTYFSPGGYLVESESYNERQAGDNPTGPLEITPSVISTNYICQVPKRKPLGDIFISVLLADLVLLQAAWKLYTFAVTGFMLRKQSKAMHCEGCIDGEESEGEKMAKYSGLAKHSPKRSGMASSVSSLDKGGRREDFTVIERIRKFVSFNS